MEQQPKNKAIMPILGIVFWKLVKLVNCYFKFIFRLAIHLIICGSE